MKIFSLKTMLLLLIIGFTPLVAGAKTNYKTYSYGGKYTLPMEGNPKAKVVVLEYYSFTCPHCASFQNDHYPTIKKKFIDTNRIAYVAVPFPLDTLAETAVVSVLQQRPERYYEFLNLVFGNFDKWARTEDPTDALSKFLLMAGVKMEPLYKTTMPGRMEQMVTKRLPLKGSLKRAATLVRNVKKHAAGVDAINSTPSITINGKLFTGARENLPKAIEKALKEK